jgi:hypothetical protein
MAELEKGWLKRQIDEVQADTDAVGGSWEPGAMIGHAHRQQKAIATLREALGLMDAYLFATAPESNERQIVLHALQQTER